MPGRSWDLAELVVPVLPCGMLGRCTCGIRATSSGGLPSLHAFPLMAEHLPCGPVVEVWCFGLASDWDPKVLRMTLGKS